MPAVNAIARALQWRRDIGKIPPNEIRRIFDYDRHLLPSRYLAEHDAEARDVDSAVRSTGISPGYPSWNLLYYSVLCSLKDNFLVVEIGTHRGFSTILMAQAIKDGGMGGKIKTVDIDPSLVRIARENVTKAAMEDVVEFNTSNSLDFLKQLTTEVEEINFAFIDGDHTASQVIAEFELLEPKVSECGGKVFFDNAAVGGVAEAISQIRQKYKGNFVEFENCSWGPHGNVIWQA